MGSQQCAGCLGTGRGSGVGGACIFCNGTGRIWVPDPPGGGTGWTGPGGGGGGSIWQAPFEENFASILAIGAGGYVLYVGLTDTEVEWYWILGIAFGVGALVYALFKGPLRFVSTFAKYIFFAALVGMAIYGIYITIKLFV